LEKYDEVLLEYLRIPHLRQEAIKHFGSESVSSAISRLYKRRRLVKSAPVRVEIMRKGRLVKVTSCFYANASMLRSGGSLYVPRVNQYVKFYYCDSWEKQFTFQKVRVTGEMLLRHLEIVEAATPTELAQHFNVPIPHISTVLQGLVRSGKIVRRGKINEYGREVKIPRVGFIYGVDYDAISQKIKEVLHSAKLAPIRSRVIRRINADSRQGEITAQVIFRSPPFNLNSAELVKISNYLEKHKDFEIARWGSNCWFYNRKLILQVLTQQELEEKIRSATEAAKGLFSAKTLAGIALEIAVRKALKICEEFDTLTMNIYIPSFNPFGKELDFIATKRFLESEKVYPQVYVGEIKLTNVRKPQIKQFYEKLRHTPFVSIGNNTIQISNEVNIQITKKFSIPIKTVRGNVTPIYIAAGFTKDAIEECKKYGIIWLYADSLLERLGERKRRRIYASRIYRIVERWINEMAGKIEFVSRKDVHKKLEKLLNNKLGI